MTLGLGGAPSTNAAAAAPVLDQVVRFVLIILVVLVGTAFVTTVINSGGKIDEGTAGRTAEQLRAAMKSTAGAADSLRKQANVPTPDASTPVKLANKVTDLAKDSLDIVREGHAPLVRQVATTLNPMERNLLIGVVVLATLLMILSVWRAARATPPPSLPRV
ncbi:MAG: hypothetical protein HZA54_14520 [Planctomycetes bacterium]|nr:hypothetical protein [Planctomycetota bacterium]